MTDAPQPRTSFNWKVYADATFAGLAPLIPIPGLDWVFEEIFRRRIPHAVARERGKRLAPEVAGRFNAGQGSCLAACLTLPVKLVIELVKRLSRKLLYFLAVKEATDKVSYYWHLAFLVDYALLDGHLEDEYSAWIARQTADQVLSRSTTSPLTSLAGQVANSTRQVTRTLFRARRREETEGIARQKEQMRTTWGNFEEYLKSLAVQYHLAYQEKRRSLEAQAAGSASAPPTSPGKG